MDALFTRLLDAATSVHPAVQVHFCAVPVNGNHLWVVRIQVDQIILVQSRPEARAVAVQEVVDKLEGMSQRMMHAIHPDTAPPTGPDTWPKGVPDPDGGSGTE